MEKKHFRSSGRITYRAIGAYKKVVVDNPITLQVLQEGCCKAFLEIVGDIEDVMQDYDIAIIDGKSQLTCDDEIPQRRRTFGFYWKKKGIDSVQSVGNSTTQTSDSHESEQHESHNSQEHVQPDGVGETEKPSLAVTIDGIRQNNLGLAKLLFERNAESKYSAEKSTLACASRRCCFQNERLDEIDKEFGVDNYLVVPAAYDPVEWGWELTGFSIVQDNEEKSFIERDRDSHEKAFDIKVCRATPEMKENGVIAHGPTETVCLDEDECIIIGCISYYHCTMEVDYSWSVNGIMLKTGRKANLVYVNQPGQYQCVVTVNDHVAKSQVIEVVEERSNIAAKEEDNPIDPLALLQSDASSQEKDVYSVDPSTIKKGEVVGQSQFGTVYKGEWRGTEIAIKTITLPPEKQNSWEDIKELQICRKIRHPNLLLLMGYCRNNDDLWLLFPYIKGSNLEKLIFSTPPPFQILFDVKPYIMHQVASGCHYLHEENIVHQDLKPANILVEKRTYHTVICDFGVSSFTATAITRNTANAGTMMYQHKESILGKRAEPYMDVYAMGCIILELYTSKRAWNDISNPGQLVAKIISNEYPYTDHLKEYPMVKELVDGCFMEPKQRLCMVELVTRLDKLVDREKF